DDDRAQPPAPRPAEWQTGFRPVLGRDERLDPRVDERDQRPGTVDRDGERRGDQHAGDEIGAQLGPRARRLGYGLLRPPSVPVLGSALHPSPARPATPPHMSRQEDDTRPRAAVTTA